MSEELKPLYDKEVKCPICANSYTTKKVRSRFIRVEKTESDFFTHYKEMRLNPTIYEASVCPKCGYAFSDAFSRNFPPGTIERIKAQITVNWKERCFSGERTIEEAIDVYKLAILSASLKEEKNVVIAGLCLKLSWLCRMIEDGIQEQRFMKLSLERYKNSFIESDYVGTQLTEMRLIYLIGELSRRVGNCEEAVKNFSKVIHHKNRSLESRLVEMAREQWYLIRETNKAESRINVI
jgi:uncharacterized protein